MSVLQCTTYLEVARPDPEFEFIVSFKRRRICNNLGRGRDEHKEISVPIKEAYKASSVS